MNITDEFALIVAERDQLKRENESYKMRLAKNAGALDENRAENRQLLATFSATIERQAARIAIFEKHFYDFHGSAERIQKQKTETETVTATPPPAPEVPNTILGKLSRLGLKTEVAA